MTQPTVTFEVVPAFVYLIKLTFVGWGSYKSTWSILAPCFSVWICTAQILHSSSRRQVRF